MSTTLPIISPELRARISAHTPLLFTTTTLQPYLPLPHPSFPNRLSLTLPHPSDLSTKLSTLNHPSVYPMLQGPPYPYTESDAQQWDSMLLSRWESCLKYWEQGDWENGLQVCPCPVNNLRLAKEGEEQGEGEWVGDLGVFRWKFQEVEDEEERGRLVQENEKRLVGEDGLIWSFGFFLSPTYQNLSIPTHALRTLLTTWYTPSYLLQAKTIRSAAFITNPGSRRVQEKSGMRLVSSLRRRKEDEDEEQEEGLTFVQDVSESRGGGQMRVWVFEWQEVRDGSLEGRFL